MPNWCNNTITITGPKDKITALYNEATKTQEPGGDFGGLLNGMRPMPKELEGTTSPTPTEGKVQPLVDGYDNWYDWRINNWGTKWEVDSEGLELSKDGTTITGWFDSAWSPPTGAYEHFLANNEDCSIHSYFYEGGMDFGGEWDDGCDTTINPSDYTADQMEDPNAGLIYELNEHFGFSEWVREYEEEQKTDTEKFIVEKEAVNVQ